MYYVKIFYCITIEYLLLRTSKFSLYSLYYNKLFYCCVRSGLRSKICFRKRKPGRLRLPNLALRGPGSAHKPMKTNGRPPKAAAEKRTKRVSFAVTEEEYIAFQTLAGHGERVVREDSKKPMPTRKRSIAGIIRKSLLSKGGVQSITDAERKALAQMAGMARNLNQLATQANAQGYASAAYRDNEIADQLREIINRIRENLS